MIRLVLLVAVLLTLPACAPEPAPPTPAQEAVFAQEVDVELVVTAQKNAMVWETTRIEAPAGATVRIVMDNSETTSRMMVHNVVVVPTAADAQRVGRAATATDGEPVTDPAILAYTPLAGPGERTAVVFTMPPAGEYIFVCTYPGHYSQMQGVLVSTPA